MMLLNELTLRRFRNHENRTLSFPAGVTGIVGCNGSGKSSIIEAIGFLFTGETDDPKDAVITAGSNGASFVRGTFTLNDKVGTIERHLDSSRVVLEYDGLKLHKAGEVKELWTKLLQIDGHIFNHVIVAKQKRIPELFSGETQIREKAFQRIFMVPNTERLRSLIWDSYMKTCPPPLPEDDIQAIDKQVQDLQAQVGPRQEKLNLLSDSTLTDHQVTAVLNYTEYYNKCISDAEQQPALESQRAQLQTNIAVFAEKIVSLQDTLDKWPKDLEQEKQVCYSAYERHLAYNKKASELNGAKTDLVNLQVDGEVLGAEILVLEEKKTALGGKKIALDMEISKLTEEQSLLSSLVSSPTCPTCHQPLQDVASHLAEVQQKLLANNQLRSTLSQEFNEASSLLALKKGRLAKWKTATEQVTLLTEQLRLSEADAYYDPEKLNAVLLLINSQKAFEQQLNTTINNKIQAEAALGIVNEKIAHLVTYTGTSSPAEELSLMQEVLQRHRARLQEVNALKLELVQLTTEIQVLTQRRTASMVNHAKNLDRTEYMNKLRMAYELLHMSQFPRKLVQTYSSVVEDELHQQLQRFALPYNAQINEEFKIVITKEGHTIPRLSGGQEMVVGLCLRLALHSMFSQAFPMLIVDEGTTHLDDANKKLYFQCINDLKSDKVIQQLIIIDHDALLTDVVDNVIRL